MTLEEAYMEYYGSQASPQPFLHAVSNLVDAAASADSGSHYILISGLPGSDFENVARPSEETCSDCPLGENDIASCQNNLLQDVIDKNRRNRILSVVWTGKCSHGGLRDRASDSVGSTRGGINKELPTSCFSPHSHLHQEAAEQAIQATEYYIDLIRGGIGNAMFSRLFSLHPTPAIVLVLDTTDSMDEELETLTHVVGNLLKKHSRASYPPAEYILVPFNDPYFAGQVVRSQTPDEIYSALTQLRAVGGGDEPEYSMSALRLALHYAPSYSHVFLITDASIKDPEVFDSVVAMAQAKKIQVTPVLTMPLTDGGILGRSNLPVNDFSRFFARKKRQLPSFGKYLELAHRSGGQVIETPSDLVEETSKIFEAEQYYRAVLWRGVDIRYTTEIKFPVDSLVSEFEVSISGMVNAAVLTSPTGEGYDLSTYFASGDKQPYTVVVNTPYLIQVRLNMTQRQRDVGEWTLEVDPSGVTSVAIYARTTMDILPVFYRPDSVSAQPSLQKINGQPGKGITTYLDIVVTGVDTARLRSVERAYLRDTEGQELLELNFPISTPRRNTYIPFPIQDLTNNRFSVVVAGKDASGNPFRRESGVVWEMTESLLEFSLGRDVWGYPGDILTIPFTITNTNGDSSNTYFIEANDAKGTPIILSQRRINLGRNETVQLNLETNIPISDQPGATSTIVITATSTKGDTSYALAHMSVMPTDRPRLRKRQSGSGQYNDFTPPTISVSGRSSCRNHLTPETCNYPWTVNLHIQDTYPGLLRVRYTPNSQGDPIFTSGIQDLRVTYASTCCSPTVRVEAWDLATNPASKMIDNGDLSANQLSAGAVSGIVLGTIAALILLILLIVLVEDVLQCVVTVVLLLLVSVLLPSRVIYQRTDFQTPRRRSQKVLTSGGSGKLDFRVILPSL
ncbi:Von Willebrand factor A [Halocaridina rubra]|uniref:von Willebrand factor A n=1 Tax=Halocaridina rubra TaxID=373956 RepID=A0AAN9AE00_HALRR